MHPSPKAKWALRLGAEGRAVVLRMPRLQSQGSVGLLARAVRPKPGMEGPGFSYPLWSWEAQVGHVWAGCLWRWNFHRRLGSKNAVGLETTRNQL